MTALCIECGDRRCDDEEDEICRHCFEIFIEDANMKRLLRIAAGWNVDATGAVTKPK